jgi:hypothetical protein
MKETIRLIYLLVLVTFFAGLTLTLLYQQL